jgi:hypothetical protein
VQEAAPGYRHVRVLDVSRTALQEPGVLAVAAAIPSLRVLSLAGCRGLQRGLVESAAVPSWLTVLATRLPALTALDLRGLDGLSLSHVRALGPAAASGALRCLIVPPAAAAEVAGRRLPPGATSDPEAVAVMDDEEVQVRPGATAACGIFSSSPWPAL